MSEQIPDGSGGNLVPRGGGPLRKPFDYTQLDPDLAGQARAAARRIQQMERQTLENVIGIGNELLAMKEALPHRHFGPWLKAEFGWGRRMAEHFMNVARLFGPKSEIISLLGIAPTAAYLLAAPSAPGAAAEEAIRRAQGGEKITPPVARQIIAAHRRAPGGEDVLPEEPVKELKRELMALLESLRRRWDREHYPLLARQLQGFIDSLGEK